MLIKKECIVLGEEGNQVYGVWHQPLGTSHYPAVLFLHGLGGHKSGRFRVLYRLADRLAHAGIGALRIDFRGAGDSDRSFEETTLKSLMEDAILGYKWLASRSDVNDIGIHGSSFGSAVAIKLGMSHIVKAICCWVPIFNSKQWKKEDLPTVVPNPEFVSEMLEFDLEKDLKQLAIPLFHIHAGKDETLNGSHQAGFFGTRSGSLGKGIVLTLSDHTFSRLEDQKVIIEESFQWWIEVLQSQS